MKIERIIAENPSIAAPSVERSINKEKSVLSSEAVILDTEKRNQKENSSNYQENNETKRSLQEELESDKKIIKRLGSHIDLVA